MPMISRHKLPVIVYFSGADTLRQFKHFAVEKRFPSVEGKAHISYDVVGTEISTGQRTVLAEWPDEGPAATFCEMAEICSRH